MLDGAGNRIGNEFQVNSYTAGEQWGAEIAALTGGGFVVTWTSGYGQDGSDWGTYGRVFDGNGTAVTAEFLVNTATDGIQDANDVAAMADSGFVVVWNADDATGDTIRAQRFDAAGGTVGSETVISEGTGNHFFWEPSIAPLASDGFVVAWHESDNSVSDVFARQFAARYFGTMGRD